ncbi:MAG: redoxin domain-containing protein [Prevotella sp.]|nr:redoxin domain-containing protein [Prevotella sp.]
MKIRTICFISLLLILTSCGKGKFHVSGNITNAADSTLYWENMSLNGAIAVDSAKLDADGAFSFHGFKPEAPDFYRLRIGQQIINIAVDSTENITIKADYPTMSAQYEVEGSEECQLIKQLALRQLALQSQINAIAQDPSLNTERVADSISNVLYVYKENIKNNYIFNDPKRASAYFALFQTVALGYQNALIFNPRTSENDVKVFGAVATSWDTYYPEAERGINLHNIAIEGMKNVRILQARNSQSIDPNKITEAGVIDIALPDNKGNIRRLTDLKGKVVLLDFHLFASSESTERIMNMRNIYNKFHDQGLEIYQVSIDPDEHFWKTQTAALPWISVRDPQGVNSPLITQYNLLDIPTFFLITKENVLHKRDAQIKDLESEIRSLL